MLLSCRGNIQTALYMYCFTFFSKKPALTFCRLLQYAYFL